METVTERMAREQCYEDAKKILETQSVIIDDTNHLQVYLD